MKLAFIASFIIGGLLWLSVFQVNNNTFRHSGSQTLYQTVKIQNEALAQLLERDLRRVGFGVSGHGILVADSTNFSFESNFRNQAPAPDPLLVVTWEAKAPVDIGDGRSEIVLQRVGPEDNDSNIQTRDYSIGAESFTFRYLDEDMVETNQPSEIRHIYFRIVSESEQRYGDRFERHALERTVTPRNLNINLSAGS